MARTKDRQRALARAKLERQIARRAAAARRKRQIQAGTAVGISLVLIVLGGLWVSGAFEPDKKKPVAQDCAWTPQTGDGVKDVGTPPKSNIPKSGIQTMTITTNQGVIEALIDTAKARCTAASFNFLAGKQFFNDTKCHRLTTAGIFVLQCGDPSGTGRGGPAYRFPDENLPDPTESPSAQPSASAPASPSAEPSAEPKALYKAGTLAMANSGPDTNGSQFFIVYKDTMFEPKYTVLGTVKSGLDVVEKIAAGGVAEGGESATDGKPKIEVTISSLTMAPPGAAPEASNPSGSGAPSPAPSAAPSGSASNPQS